MAFVCFLIVSRFMTGCKGTVRRKDHDIHCVILGGIACYESFVTRKTLITTLLKDIFVKGLKFRRTYMRTRCYA